MSLALMGGCLLLNVAALAAQNNWKAEQRGQAGKDLNAVYFSDSKRGWTAGDDGIVLHTEDGGRTWARQLIDTTDSINDIYFRDKGRRLRARGQPCFQNRRQRRDVARGGAVCSR
ncbi:MAG: hypothetical protein M3430_04560 [Acidobacteriota bacterium]|nr:hypothetical protein [Acidobacteriota bacterium]